MAEIIDLFKNRSDPAYLAIINRMDKLELMEEMVPVQEWRTRIGTLTPTMIIRGIILFNALEQAAETFELKLLTRSYKRHLEHERDNISKS